MTLCPTPTAPHHWTQLTTSCSLALLFGRCTHAFLCILNRHDLSMGFKCLSFCVMFQIFVLSIINAVNNKASNVRITEHWGAFGNHCYRGKAVNITYSECASLVLFIQHAKRLHRVILSSVASPTVQHFSTLSHKRHDFRKRGIGYKMCVLIFSTTFESSAGTASTLQAGRSGDRIPVGRGEIFCPLQIGSGAVGTM